MINEIIDDLTQRCIWHSNANEGKTYQNEKPLTAKDASIIKRFVSLEFSDGDALVKNKDLMECYNVCNYIQRWASRTYI